MSAMVWDPDLYDAMMARLAVVTMLQGQGRAYGDPELEEAYAELRTSRDAWDASRGGNHLNTD